MPEGDTIWRAAAMLRERLTGCVLERAAPAPLRRLVGRRLIGVEPVGKHLFMRFEGGLSLHSHMRMTGVWHVYVPGESWRRPRHRATAVLGFGELEAVLFAAPVLEVVADDRATTEHLGPDILASPWAIEAILTRARTSPATTIGELLLDQRVCAGIGNIHKCDALWVERVDPWSAPADLDNATLRRIYATARSRMRISAVATPAARPRRGVHGRAGLPCPRCGSRILARPQGQHARLTYWCPRCQARS